MSDVRERLGRVTERIVTVTANPTVDVSTSVDELVPERKLRCAPMRLEPGGGGINCARVVVELGGTALAVYAAGGATGALLDDLLGPEDLETTRVDTDALTRLGLHVRDERAGAQYRFVLPGPDVDAGVADAVLAAVEASSSPGVFVIGSGSLPPGMPDDVYARLAERVHAADARLVLDTAGPWLQPALDVHVDVLRLNRREFAELLGDEMETDGGAERTLRSLVESEAVRVAVMSLGADGSLAVSSEGAWMVSAPQVDVVSTVGAGDSFTAALTLGLAAGLDLPRATAYGVAAGAAAVTTPGTRLCPASTTDELYADTLRRNGLS